jgi:hypothetical protein
LTNSPITGHARGCHPLLFGGNQPGAVMLTNPEMFFADAEMCAEWAADPESYRGVMLPREWLEVIAQTGYLREGGTPGWYWRAIAENDVTMVEGPFTSKEEAVADLLRMM